MQETSVDYNLSRSDPHTSKKRKISERVVVTVKIKEHDKKQQKSEGPPSDSWSWRKYGQKPIKGSPYPRGYYKCSTSKGCSAKKQVERCKIDASMLIITYTSTHNHLSLSHEEEKLEPENSAPNTPKQDQETQVELQEDQTTLPNDTDDQFYYSQSPFNSSQDHIMVNEPFSETIPAPVLFNENVPHHPVSFSSLLKPEEYHLFDELEELPTSSFFTKSSFSEERIPVNPA